MFNHQVTEKQRQLTGDLLDFVYPWRKLTIGIDGPDGVGKSVLARFLAWELNMPLIEADLFIVGEKEPPCYRYDELKNVVYARHRLNRPVIIEGIFLLDTLSKIDLKIDRLIYVENENFNGSDQLFKPLDKYRMQYDPKKNAHYIFECEFVDI